MKKKYKRFDVLAVHNIGILHHQATRIMNSALQTSLAKKRAE